MDCKVQIEGFVSLEPNGAFWIGQYYAWDGATGIPDTKPALKASLVHDALCQLMREGKLDRDRYWPVAAEIFKSDYINFGGSPFMGELYRKLLMLYNSYIYPQENRWEYETV